MLFRNNTEELLTFYENNTTGIGRAAGGSFPADRLSVRAAGPASCRHGCRLWPRLCSRLRRSCGPTELLFSGINSDGLKLKRCSNEVQTR